MVGADAQSSESVGVHTTSSSAGFTISSPALSPESLALGQGFYQVLSGSSVDGFGTSVPSSSSTANVWSADNANQLALDSSASSDTNTSLQLTTGTDFSVPGSSGGYELAARLPFQLIVGFGCA